MHTIDVIRVTALIATLFNITLTLLIVGRDYRSTLHRVYMLFGFGLAVWNFGVYHLSQDIPPEKAFFWAKILQLGVIFLPLSMFHLCLVISRTRVGWILPILYGAHVALASTIFLDWYIVDVRKLDVGYWSVPGPAFHVFTVFYVVLTTAIMVILYRKQKSLPPSELTRLRALRLAVVSLWILASNDMMPSWGLDTYPFTHIKFYPLGSLAAMYYAVVIGYCVLQHQLLDIHVTLSRIAAQLVRLLFMMLVGFALMLVLWRLAPD